MRSHGLCSRLDVTEVWLVEIIERRWNTDDHRIQITNLAVIGSSRETVLPSRLNLRRRDADDVGTSLPQHRDLAVVDIKAGHSETLLGKQQGQRQTDVAKADDSDPGRAAINSCTDSVQRFYYIIIHN